MLLATAASAQEWTFEDLDIPIAYFDNGAAQFQFACRGGDLTMGFWVRAPHQQVAGFAPTPSQQAATTQHTRSPTDSALDRPPKNMLPIYAAIALGVIVVAVVLIVALT